VLIVSLVALLLKERKFGRKKEQLVDVLGFSPQCFIQINQKKFNSDY